LTVDTRRSVALAQRQWRIAVVQRSSSRHRRGIVAFGRERKCSLFHRPIATSDMSLLICYATHTLSRSILLISAEPEFATGINLIRFASRTDVAFVEVKKAFKLTFQCVLSHTKLCNVMIEPHHTNVHSWPPMCFSYRSSER